MNFSHDFDIVIGPVADDGVAYLLAQYQEGNKTIEQICEELTYKKLNDQYFFANKKGLAYLRRI